MKKIEKIYGALLKEYGEQGWWPLTGRYNFLPEHKGRKPDTDKRRFEIIVGAILTQNTAWRNVEKAIENLNRVRLLEIDKIRKTDVKKIAKLIRPAGYYNQKADRLKIAAEYFDRHFKDKTVPSREELLKVKGIGPETADSILLYAFEQPYFVVDAYTKRIFSRLGFFKEDEKYENVQKLFMDAFKDVKGKKKIEVFKEYHALIVELAKRSCRKKQICEDCLLSSYPHDL